MSSASSASSLTNGLASLTAKATIAAVTSTAALGTATNGHSNGSSNGNGGNGSNGDGGNASNPVETDLPCVPSNSMISGEPATCPAAADSLVKKPVKRETLLDRADAMVVGLIISTAAYYFFENLEWSNTFRHDNCPILLSHKYSFPAVALVLYLLMVHVLGPHLRKSPSTEPAFGIPDAWIRVALKYWNLFLTVLSACMLVGMGVPLVLFWLNTSYEEVLCDPHKKRWGGAAFVWMYVFNMSKYIELFDTAFMVLRRKPVSFLHWYHHTSVLLYTWFAVVVGFNPGWFFATINSGVHTIMYFYYYRSACGVRLTYDRAITTLQISQMVLGIIVTSSWAYFHYAKPDGATGCPCTHSTLMMISALLLYGSYFALFLSFYLQRYVKRRSDAKAAAAAAAAAANAPSKKVD